VRPKPGDPAPDFSCPATDGSTIRLKDFRGRKLVLYFYPMDDTPGCTAQACSLRDVNRDIAAKGAAILGVSSQDEASHQKFTSKYKLNFPLLADTDRTMAKAYGVAGGAVRRGAGADGDERAGDLHHRRRARSPTSSTTPTAPTTGGSAEVPPGQPAPPATTARSPARRPSQVAVPASGTIFAPSRTELSCGIT
jgi:peroxiredoxin Q/BCP